MRKRTSDIVPKLVRVLQTVSLNEKGRLLRGFRNRFGETEQERYPVRMSLLQEIVEKGDGIYRAKYKRDCEQRYLGQYIAIDVETGDGFIAASAAAAIRSGQSAGKPGALFRLIRIGYKTGGNPTPQ